MRTRASARSSVLAFYQQCEHAHSARPFFLVLEGVGRVLRVTCPGGARCLGADGEEALLAERETERERDFIGGRDRHWWRDRQSGGEAEGGRGARAACCPSTTGAEGTGERER